MISEPEPTDVMPTMSPPMTPIATVGIGLTFTGVVGSTATVPRRLVINVLMIIVTAASSNAMPRASLIVSWRSLPPPIDCRIRTPANADGTEPMHSHSTRRLSTVPRLACTAAPTGFITSEATRSEATAVEGWTFRSSTRIGVISAPPPMPVRPTTKPTIRPARTSAKSTCTWPQPP